MQGAEFGLRLLAGLVCPSLAEQSAAVMRFMVDERRILIGGCTQRGGVRFPQPCHLGKEKKRLGPFPRSHLFRRGRGAGWWRVWPGEVLYFQKD